jgi:hypothetical protein
MTISSAAKLKALSGERCGSKKMIALQDGGRNNLFLEKVRGVEVR